MPVKWRVTDADGVGIDDPASFRSLRLVDSPCTPLVQVTETDLSGATGLTYVGDGVWQYNWKTAKAMRGCFDLRLQLDDTSPPYVAEVVLR